ncbi:MAG TPA: HAMP domain-containing sensor histidine kinase [Candidatus Dormibacteraeota bacterium]
MTAAEHPSTTGVMDPFFAAAIAMAAQIAADPGAPSRRASFLRLEGAMLIPVAEHDEAGDVAGSSSHRLVDFPDVQRTAVTRESQVIVWADRRSLSSAAAAHVSRLHLRSSALVPVVSNDRVVGVIAVSARDDAGFSDVQLHRLITLAQLVGLGVSHDAADQALREEAELSQGLERLKGDFLNIAAHELRSPLGIINGYVSMLLDGSLPDTDQRKALLRISEKADEMGRLITEMLETARMEVLGLDLVLGPVDLLEVIDKALRTTEPVLGANQRFATRGRRASLPVMADGVRLATMIVNLLDNAIKYSPGGGDIEVAWRRRAGIAYISITDHGVGISRRQQSMLFTRFGRLVTPETSHIRGTGLGLYLAREIARLHGGDIAVRSRAGRGTTFTVTLPLASAS